nr:MAG TPA: hypothetical protein [Caudoviricetes sp.]
MDMPPGKPLWHLNQSNIHLQISSVFQSLGLTCLSLHAKRHPALPDVFLRKM